MSDRYTQMAEEFINDQFNNIHDDEVSALANRFRRVAREQIEADADLAGDWAETAPNSFVTEAFDQLSDALRSRAKELED